MVFFDYISLILRENAMNDTKKWGFIPIRVFFSNYLVNISYFQKFNTHKHIYNHLCIRNTIKDLGWGRICYKGKQISTEGNSEEHFLKWLENGFLMTVIAISQYMYSSWLGDLVQYLKIPFINSHVVLINVLISAS